MLLRQAPTRVAPACTAWLDRRGICGAGIPWRSPPEAAAKMGIVVSSSSAEVIADPARFLAEIQAGNLVYLSDLDRVVTLAEVDDEDDDMVSLRSNKTGIDNIIFVSTKGRGRHAPRIKIAVDPPDTLNAASASASMTIHDYSIRGEHVPSHIAEQARRFIERNRAVLLDYWECRIDGAQLIERLKPPESAPEREVRAPAGKTK